MELNLFYMNFIKSYRLLKMFETPMYNITKSPNFSPVVLTSCYLTRNFTVHAPDESIFRERDLTLQIMIRIMHMSQFVCALIETHGKQKRN